MKLRLCATLGLLAGSGLSVFSAATPPMAVAASNAKTTRWIGTVVDEPNGKWITISRAGILTKVRLYGVDAWDRELLAADPLTRRTRPPIKGRTATVFSVGKDADGNDLGWVFIGNFCINSHLVRTGAARFDEAGAPKEFRLAGLQDEALNRRIGGWSHPRADLMITHVVFAPDKIVAGQRFGAQVFVKNIGTARARNFSISQGKSALSPEDRGTRLDLEPGEEKAWLTGANLALAPGRYTLDFEIDNGNEIREFNETNNGFKAVVNVVSR